LIALRFYFLLNTKQVISETFSKFPEAISWLGIEKINLTHHLTQCLQGRGLPTKWQLDPSSCLATTDTGQKFGGAEAYLYAKFHLDPSNRLATIHQCHRQDNSPIA